MTTITEYAELDAIALAGLIRDGAVSAAAVLETAIARIEAVNGAVNAVCLKLYDLARAQVAAGAPLGPLGGVPFPIKDLSSNIAGTVTSQGCRRFTEVASADSTLIARYRAGGLVFPAKTNTPEFGLTVSTEPALFGPTRNPWNLGRVAGGSSGGAAAAVASGIAPIAHASDGGGSIRVPASCCGLFGLKPSRGRNPSGPDRGEGWAGLSTAHAITRSVRDSAALLDISAGPELGEPYPPPAQGGPFLKAVGEAPGRLRVAFSTRAPSGVPVDPDCVRAVEDAARLLEDLGHVVEEAAPAFDASALSQTLALIVGANTAATLDLHAEATGRPLVEGDVEPLTWRQVMNARAAGSEHYAKGVVRIHAAGRVAAAFHETYDVFVCPVLAKPPIELGVLSLSNPDIGAYLQALFGFSPFTSYANMTGQPSMSLPLHWTAEGLPVGVMITGRYGDEAGLFRLAAQIEAARPWFDKRPPLAA